MRLFLIDGYALIYRSYFAFIKRPLVTSKGENVSAVFGVSRFLQKIMNEEKPDYLGFVMDRGHSKRSELYPDYKATREKMPDDLRASLPRVRAIVEALNIPILELDNTEADDVIGTLTRLASEEDLNSIIVSGDKDFYQLINEKVHLLNPSSKLGTELVTEENATERLGIPPQQVIDYLALVGDSSDNVPGARGIGPKTALKLLEKYQTVENILEHKEEVSGKRAKNALLNGEENVKLSKKLVTIDQHLPVDLDLDALKLGLPDPEMLREILVEMEFHSMLREFFPDNEDIEEAFESKEEQIEKEYTLARSVADVNALVKRIREKGAMSVDLETTSKDPMKAKIIGMAVSLEKGKGTYIPFRHGAVAEELTLDLFDEPVLSEDNLPFLTDPAMKGLKEVIEDQTIKKTGQNLKYEIIVFRREGLTIRGIDFDTMIASYVLDPSKRQHNLDALALEVLGYKTTTYEDVCGKGKSQIPFSEVPLETARDYACEDTDIPLRLQPIFTERMEEHNLMSLFRELEMPLVHVLADMEEHGLLLDKEFFAALSKKINKALHEIEQKIYKKAGYEFNINSTPQLRTLLFEEMGLPVIKKTKTGASTDASVLEELSDQGYEIPNMLMEYRELEKLRSTYVDALPQLVNPETNRLHSSFNQTVAATGRLSSSDPNLQNIPIRTELGREIRKGFVPRKGYVLLGADYSQIELRVLAHLSEDPIFVNAFNSGADIHTETAALIYNKKAEDVTPEERDGAKTVNFSIIYGVGAYSLGKSLGISGKEAKAFIEQYFDRLPKVEAYLDAQIDKAREDGFVETILGRRRYIPEIHSKNHNIKSFGERAATNAPVQGSAADLIKKAMIDVWEALRESDLDAGMLLQVHDELVFEVREDQLDDLKALVREKMEGAFDLSVPLKVDMGSGKTWYDCK